MERRRGLGNYLLFLCRFGLLYFETLNFEQIFVFRSLESPLHTNFARLSNKEAINWTSTYRLDSDIPTPYGFFDSSRLEPSTSLPDIKGKEFKVGVVVSVCLFFYLFFFVD